MRISEVAKQKPRSGRFVAAAYVVHDAPCQCPPDKSCGECHPFVVLAEVAAAGLKQPLTPDFDLVAFLGPNQKPLERFKLYRVVFDVCGNREEDEGSPGPLRPTLVVSAEPIP